jgi:dihydroflavonol-4-reductase
MIMNEAGASGYGQNNGNHRVLVTGATGFLGRYVVRACIESGFIVRIFHRACSDLSAFEDLTIESARGEITDQTAVKEALTGCRGVFHLAGLISFNPAARDALIKTNVYGTRAVMAAALEHGIDKVVHTSTTGVLPGTQFTELSDDESAVYNPKEQSAYDASKHLAEVEVLHAAARGLNAVIVNPSLVNGPGDIRLKRLFLAENAFIIEGGVNHVDVRDVAAGQIAAYRKGKAGERYILGNAEGNLSMSEFHDLVDQIRGKKRRRIKINKKILYRALLNVEKVQQKLSKKLLPGSVSSDLLLTLDRYRFVNPSKAIRELGMPQRPVRDSFRETIAWLEANTDPR